MSCTKNYHNVQVKKFFYKISVVMSFVTKDLLSTRSLDFMCTFTKNSLYTRDPARNSSSKQGRKTRSERIRHYNSCHLQLCVQNCVKIKVRKGS